jgi:hypothetical protein
LLALLLVAATARVTGAGTEGAPPRVEYADDRLTVQAEQVEIGEVLAAVARATAAEVRGSPLGPRRVTADFEHVPLSAALQRLLGEQNFTLRYREGGRLRTIVLRGGPEAPVPPPPPAALAVAPVPPAVPPPASPPTTILLPPRFANHRPIPVSERLKEILGSDTATFDQIFELATTQKDGTVRALAMQLALSALERERVLRRALFISLRRGGDGSLGAFMQSPGAIEMLEFMAAHSREPGLQKKAGVLLDQVRPPAEPPAGG